MKRILSSGLITIFAAVGVANGDWYTAYENDFSTLDGVSTRCGEYPTACCENLRLEDGGAVTDVTSIGYAIMEIQMEDLQTENPIDFTHGEFTINLEWYSPSCHPGESVEFWLRLYSRVWDAGAGEWAFSGAQNYSYDVEQTESGPSWQSWSRSVYDWDQTDLWGPFYADQVYAFRVDAVVWEEDADLIPYSFGIDHFELSVPECPDDLDGDDDVDLADLAHLLANYGCTPPELTTAYTCGGFEGYSPGDLIGQDGWIDYTSDPNTYGMVQIVDDATGSGMGQVILLDPPGTTGGHLGAERPVDPPPSEQYVVIEWDQYRTDLGDNVHSSDSVFFDGWWAMQWDQTHQASSYYWDWVLSLTAGQWQHVTYILDTVNGTATLDIDGERQTGPTYMPDTTINGIVFNVTTTEHEGEDGPMYIDNVVISEGSSVYGCSREDGDYDGDGDVDLSDLANLLANYRCGT
jgi:hypothetical protein